MPAQTRGSQQQQSPDDVVDSTATLIDTAGSTGTAIVVKDEAKMFEVLDRLDEELVAAEIAGELIETMAYEFPMDGSMVRGLSIVGVAEAARAMAARGLGRIEMPKPPVFVDTHNEDGDPVWECQVYAEDVQNGGSTWGIADAEKFPKKRNGGVYTDRMAKRKALSKAIRNAKKQLIPLTIQVEILNGVAGIQRDKNSQTIKRVTTRRQQQIEAAAAKGDERAAAVRGIPAPGQTGQAAAGTAPAGRPAPNRDVPITAAQQRKVLAERKRLGIEDDAQFVAVLGWATNPPRAHLDKVPKDQFDDLLAALADKDGTLAELLDAANDPAHPRHADAVNIAAATIAPPAEGEQGAML